MRFLLDVGLDYLSLNRSAGTLAGGEAQRIRLASQIGSGPGRRAVRARRAVDRAAPARQPAADRHADPPARPRQHGARRRARRGDHQGRRPRRRHRPGSRRARRRDRGLGHGRQAAEAAVASRSPASTCPARGRSRCPGHAPRAGRGVARRAGRARAQPQEHRRRVPARLLRGRHRRVGLGQVHARQRHPVPGADAAHLQVEDAVPGRHKTIEGVELLDKVINIDQSPIGRTPRSNPATYTGVFDHDPQALQPDAGGQGPRLPARAASRSTSRAGAARPAPATAPSRSRCTSCPTCTCRARCARAPATTATPSTSRSRARTSPRCSTCSCEEALEFFANQPAIARHMQTLVDVGLGYVRLGPAGADAVRRRGPAGQARQRAGQALHRPHHLHPRRAHDRPPLRGHPQAAHRAQPARRPGQHRPRHRAQPRRHQDGRLGHRPGARREATLVGW